jgi:hypothetical protein
MTAHHVDTLRLPGASGRQGTAVRKVVWRTGLAPAAFAIVFTVAQLSDVTGVPMAFCAFKSLVGIPCPGCGITTSIEALLHGSFAGALSANPAGPLVLLFAIAQLLLTAAAAARFLPDVTIARLSRLNDRALLVFLLLAWLTRFI